MNESEAATKLQAAVKGYRSRKAMNAAKLSGHYPAADDDDDEEEDDDLEEAYAGSHASRTNKQHAEEEEQVEVRFKECLVTVDEEEEDDDDDDDDDEEEEEEEAKKDRESAKEKNKRSSKLMGDGVKSLGHRIINSFQRKRIVKEAALIGKGMGIKNNLILQRSQDQNATNSISFLSSSGNLQSIFKESSSKLRFIPLKKKHWLEALDTKHRYGANLAPYYQAWKESNTNQNFFYWLDHGSGKETEIEEVPRILLDKEVITYCNKSEREEYEVSIDDGILVYKISKIPVDTKERTLEIFDDDDDDDEASGSIHTPRSVGTGQDHISNHGTWIFVCSPEGKIYIGRKRLKPPRFQHSSFLAGGAALAAGQMDVDNGKIVEIRAFSGHYRPQKEQLIAFLNLLHDKGVDTKTVTIKLFKNKQKHPVAK